MDANEVINYGPADAKKRLQQVFIGRKLFRHPKPATKEVEKENCYSGVNITLNIQFSKEIS